MEWWPRLVDSEEAASMWIGWRQQTNGQLWEGLRQIDEKLRLLPGNLYESIGQMETVFSQLYYLNIPRETLNSILALLVLREKTCHELGIEMRPMTEADYANGESDGDSISMNDFSESFQKLPTNTAWSLYSGMFTLLGWNHKWLKNSPMFHQQILAKQQELQDRQEQKQDQIIDSMEKVANKPTTQNIYGDKNEFQDGAQLLKMAIPEGIDPAEIAARIAEQQQALLEQKNNSKKDE